MPPINHRRKSDVENIVVPYVIYQFEVLLRKPPTLFECADVFWVWVSGNSIYLSQ